MGSIQALSHRVTAATMAVIASAGMALCATAGFSCSFVQVIVTLPDFVLITPWGDEVPSAGGSASLGVDCRDLGGGNGGGEDENLFYDTSDRMWYLSRIFLYCSLACGGLAVLWAWTLTLCLSPTPWRWRSLSVLTAVTAVLQVPIFLILESDTCNYDINRQSCRLSVGSYLNMASVGLWIMVTLATQCVRPPRWAEELDAWRTVTHVRPTKSISVVRGCPTESSTEEGSAAHHQPSPRQQILQHDPLSARLSPLPFDDSYGPTSLDEGGGAHQQSSVPRDHQYTNDTDLNDSAMVLPVYAVDVLEDDSVEGAAARSSGNCLKMSTMCAAPIVGNRRRRQDISMKQHNQTKEIGGRWHHRPQLFSSDDIYGDNRDHQNRNGDGCSIDLSQPTVETPIGGGDEDMMSATDREILRGATRAFGECHPAGPSKDVVIDMCRQGSSAGRITNCSQEAVATGGSAHHDRSFLSNSSDGTPPGFKVSCVYSDGTREEVRVPTCINMAGKIRPSCPLPDSYHMDEERRKDAEPDIPDCACGEEENDSIRMDFLTRRMQSDAAAKQSSGDSPPPKAPLSTIEIDTSRRVKTTVGLRGVDEDRYRSQHGSPVYKMAGGGGGGIQGPPGYHADDVSEMTRGSGLASGVSDVLDSGQNATMSILEDLARPY